MVAPKLRFKEFDGDWAKYKISEVTEYLVDGTHFSPKSTDGDFKYITSKNIRNDGLDLTQLSYISKEEHEVIYKRCKVHLGDILLTKDGANTGNCCLNTLEEEFSLLSSVAVLRGKQGQFNNHFILQILQGDVGQNTIISSMSGQAITRITLSKLKDYSFNFPHFEEQTKIATFLSAVDEKIAQLSQKRHLFGQYKQGMMQKLFTQKIRFKADDGSDFDEWDYVELGDVLSYEQPTKYIVSSTEYMDIYPIPVLTAGKSFILGYTNEDVGIFDATNNNVIIFDDFTTAYKFVNFRFKVKSSAMKILKTESEKDNIYYLYSILSTLNFRSGDEHKRRWISEYSKQEIPLPCLDEQTKIANFLSAIDQKIDVVSEQLKQAKTWKKGLLQQMFV